MHAHAGQNRAGSPNCANHHWAPVETGLRLREARCRDELGEEVEALRAGPDNDIVCTGSVSVAEALAC